MKKSYELSIPNFFEADKVDQIRPVPYLERAEDAQNWINRFGIKPAASDKLRICVMPIDVQNTFCIPGFELFVGGQSGTGAVDDTRRLCEFIYRNLGIITEIAPTMDTHTAMQIFHPIFWVNDDGEHPLPAQTVITYDDVKKGVWKVNPAVATIAGGNYVALQQYAIHYVRSLEEQGKLLLMVWPYHAMLGGIGHALVPVLEEAIFFHTIARRSQAGFEIKGGNPLTENYSVLRPEVLEDSEGRPIAQKNSRFIKKLLDYDIVIAAGQAKSHCFAWTISDLLNEINTKDPDLAKKVYLLEDCTSPVVVPGVIDFTEQANEAFDEFKDAGMNVVRSDVPIEDWPGVNI